MPPGEHSFLSIGETASCTLNDAGTASCWGDTSCGVTEAPITPMNYVDVGACMACGISTEGNIECWEMKMLQQNSSICQRKVISFK